MSRRSIANGFAGEAGETDRPPSHFAGNAPISRVGLVATTIVVVAFAVLSSTASSGQDLGPRPTFPSVDIERAVLGQKLFYDPILSGNRNVSCATCHHPRFGTSDGVSLSIGDGGVGLGPDRVFDPENPPEQHIPRNSPGLWNLGADEFTRFFHDGRLELDPDRSNGIRTPLGDDMANGFQSALAAQAMFPVLSPDEMAGHYGENEISKSVRLGLLSQPGGAWDQIADRVAGIPEYRAEFESTFPGEDITFVAIANVIADFIAFEWRADDAPFDKAMRGELELPSDAQAGLELFYGSAGCSTCHSGWFQTDHGFHAIAVPQFGPGKAAAFENHSRDEGRFRVTGALKDAYAFRTPSLRNVTLTGPYGHTGAFPTLEGIIQHHLDPLNSLATYRSEDSLVPPLSEMDERRGLLDSSGTGKIASFNELAPSSLSEHEIAELIAFLAALEDRAERLGVPVEVPSGLPVGGL